MTDNRIACYYHPTTVVFIDDKQSFLESILMSFNSSLKAQTFTNAKKAVEYLKGDCKLDYIERLLQNLRDKESDDELGYNNIEHSIVDVDIMGIHKTIYNPKRFAMKTVVVVDYSMPDMNGLEVCKALQGLPLKFIMLTGKAEPETAIEAFNKGLIHRFVKKETLNFAKKLQAAIVEMQKQKFYEVSEPIVKMIASSSTSCLDDSVFIEFFNKFCEENKIVEYYLVNESGCFLLLDIEGNISWFVIKNEKEMTDYQDIAEANLAPQSIIDALKQRKKVLFLFTQADENISVTEWNRYLHVAQKLAGAEGEYYYSHVKDTNIYHLDKDKIISYKDFLLKG
ncbi:MAG: response regulator [Gammaproteobacteria bacterium]|jgi:CheY-like chemotaxis protein